MTPEIRSTLKLLAKRRLIEARREKPKNEMAEASRYLTVMLCEDALAYLEAQPADIFDEIAAERVAQDKKWGGAEHDDRHLPRDWLYFITKHAVAALVDGQGFSVIHWRRQMVRVAALAIAAAESAERVITKARREQAQHD